jgi:hypothetical protein
MFSTNKTTTYLLTGRKSGEDRYSTNMPICR